MAQLFGNNLKTTLSAAITTSGQTSITVAGGSVFPAIASPDVMTMVLDDGTNIEIVSCTAHTAASTTQTIVRAQEGTTAQSSFAIGTKVEMRLTAASVIRVGMSRKAISSVTTLAFGDGPFVVCTGSSNYNVTLPTAVGMDGEYYHVVNNGTAVVSVVPNGAQTIGYLALWELERGDFVEFFSDNANWFVRAATYRQRTKLFLAGGTFRAPQGCTSVLVTCQGAGGGGGGADGLAGNENGGGGASGECRTASVVAVPGTDYTALVGSGGTAGTTAGSNGGSGGSSALGALLSAAGGLGGLGMTASGNGAGGAGTTSLSAATAFGNTHLFPFAPSAAGAVSGAVASAPWLGAVSNASATFAGYNGGFVGGSGASTAGGGGASLWGNGAIGASSAGATGANGATPTANTGAGGSGAASGAVTPAAHSGGPGATGFVRVTWYQ